jgi:hypothetical protein
MGRTADLPRRGEASRLRLARHHGADAWEWLQREEHLFGAFEISHYRPKERQNSVCVVHPKAGEEAWRQLFDETGEALFPELMPELDAINAGMISGAGVPARPSPPQASRAAALEGKRRRPRLFARHHEGDHALRRPARRAVVHLVPARRLRRGRGFRSQRCRTAHRWLAAKPSEKVLAVARALARLHAWIDHEAAKKQPPARTKPADLSE